MNPRSKSLWMTPAALGAVSLDHAQVRFVATEPAVDERGHLLTMQRAQALDRELLLQLVEATPAGYKEKGRFRTADQGFPSWAHPVVSGGRLYIRDQGTLAAYDIKAR